MEAGGGVGGVKKIRKRVNKTGTSQTSKEVGPAAVLKPGRAKTIRPQAQGSGLRMVAVALRNNPLQLASSTARKGKGKEWSGVETRPIRVRHGTMVSTETLLPLGGNPNLSCHQPRSRAPPPPRGKKTGRLKGRRTVSLPGSGAEDQRAMSGSGEVRRSSGPEPSGEGQRSAETS